jgi:hypothetical protein
MDSFRNACTLTEDFGIAFAKMMTVYEGGTAAQMSDL